MRRLLASVLAAALAVPLFAADEAAPAKPAEPACAYEEVSEDGWGSVRPYGPNRDDRTLGTDAAQFVGFGIDRRGGSLAAVVDKREMQVSHDAGCNWNDDALSFDGSLDLGGDFEPSTAAFLDVEVADRADRIVAFAHDLDAWGAARPRVLVSEDGGGSFTLGGAGLPEFMALGRSPAEGCGHDRGCQLEISPADPDVVLLSLSDEAFRVPLYRSIDGGRSFEAITQEGSQPVQFNEARRPYSVDTFALDPVDAERMWVGENRTLYATSNGGRTWHPYDLRELVGGDVTQIEAVSVAGDGDVVVAQVALRSGTSTLVTMDRGATWDVFTSDLHGDDELHDLTGAGNDVFATTKRGASRLDFAQQAWQYLDGSSLGPLYDVQPIFGASTVWFRGPSTLPVMGDLAFLSPPAPPDFGLDFEIPPFDPLDPPENLDGRFVWDNEVINLEVGSQRQIDMLFALPLRKTKLDVFFLFDQSGSMSEEMEALARSMTDIVRELGRRDILVHAGLGGYSGGWRYIRHADIQDPSNPEFTQAMSRLRAGGGYETAYTALHQVATGTGLPDSPAGFGPDEGWNANWRPGAVRIVVNLTDERLQVEESPTIGETIDALQERQIKVINLISDVDTAVRTGTQGDPTSVDSGIDTDHPFYGAAAQLSKATNALAGPSGVDCGGDGEVDIPPGGPIACFISPIQTAEEAESLDVIASFSDVMVEILEGVTEEHLIEFFRSDSALIPRIQPLDSTFRDVRKHATIRLKVMTACDAAHAGAVHDPLITAVASSDFLAAAKLVIVCGPLAAAPGLPAVATPPAPAAVAAAPAPPPPAPVQAPAPAQGIAQAANPATAQALTPQVGVAAAAQKQRQAQAASIGPAGPAGDEGAEFAFTSRAPRDPAPAVLLAGAVMASAAGAVALRRRSASSPSRARA